MNQTTQIPVAIAIQKTKTKLIQAVNQATRESNLPPSIVIGILDTIRAQYMENTLLELTTLYDDVVNAKGKEEEV